MNKYWVIGIVLVALIGLFVLGCELKKRTAFFEYYSGKNNVKIIRDIVYKENSINPKQRLDLYLPKTGKNFPMVLFIHGGYWTSGDKNYIQWGTGLYGNMGVALAQKGIGVAVANYRLYPESGIDGQIDDVLNSLSWLQKNAVQNNGSGDIFLMGHSAGGHLISLLGTQPDRLSAKGISTDSIRAYISLSAVWDISDMVTKNDTDFNNNISYPLFGHDSSNYGTYSPLASVGKISKPFFVGIGDDDFPYLMGQATIVNDKMNSLGISHEYEVMPGYTHADMVTHFGSDQDLLAPKIVDFINKKYFSLGSPFENKKNCLPARFRDREDSYRGRYMSSVLSSLFRGLSATYSSSSIGGRSSSIWQKRPSFR